MAQARIARTIVYQGHRLALVRLLARHGHPELTTSTLAYRGQVGWPLKRALTEPPRANRFARAVEAYVRGAMEGGEGAETGQRAFSCVCRARDEHHNARCPSRAESRHLGRLGCIDARSRSCVYGRRSEPIPPGARVDLRFV